MRFSSLPFKARHVVWIVTITFVVIWIGYLLAGQQLIGALYHSESSWLAGKFMPGRASTSLEAYYRQFDAVLVHATLSLIAVCAAMWLLLRNARGLLLFVLSCLVSSFLLFCLFEMFPALVPLTHLDNVLGYYAYKANYIPDPELAFREKPFGRCVIDDFTGAQYSRRYGIEVRPYSIEWIMDKDGFRNQRPATAADVVVLGDSYIEYGSNEADTFVGRLAEKLPRVSARNLGKSGYSVGQYVQVLKRFGLQYKPRIAVMAFYEGNDIPELRDYLLWKSGRTSELRGYLFKFTTDSLWRRYIVAVTASIVELRKIITSVDDVLLGKLATIRGYGPGVHPEVAILNLNGRRSPILFTDLVPDMTVDQMLATEELHAIRGFFDEFRKVCETNRITPLILYIPTASHIYAPYSTQASGSQWLTVRDRQIAARQNTETAMKIVADESGVDFISFTPVFERAAAEGKMVYYAVDAHWNAEGREIAARFVADALEERFRVSSSKSGD